MVKSVLVLVFLGFFQLLSAQPAVKKNSIISDTSNTQRAKTIKALLVVKSDIIRLLKKIKNKEWHTFHLTIEAPPFTNKGYNSTPVFLDVKGNKINVSWDIDQEQIDKVLTLIFEMNQKEIRNQVIFFTNRNDYDQASIFTSFSQNIDETFQSRLPESMRGKTIPWFKTKK